ncbi:MAG: histidine kinase [Chitinophagales bacterium]
MESELKSGLEADIELFRVKAAETPALAFELYEALRTADRSAVSLDSQFDFFRGAVNLHLNSNKLDEAQYYLHEAHAFVNRNPDERRLFFVAISDAILICMKGEVQAAIQQFKQILLHLPELNKDIHAAHVHMQLAVAYGRAGEYQACLESGIAALQYFDKSADPARFVVRINLLNLYAQLNMHKELFAEYQVMEAIIEDCQVPKVRVVFHTKYAEYLTQNLAYAKALEQINVAFTFCTNLTDMTGLSLVYRMKSEVLEKLGRDRLSYLYKLRNYEVCHTMGNQYNLSLALISLCSFLRRHQKDAKVMNYAQRAYAVSREHDFKVNLRTALELLAEIKEEAKEFELAAKYLRELNEVKEKILNEEAAKAVADAAAKYELVEKEKEAQRLRSEVAETDLRLLRSQMNPHFIFNSINSINNFILKNKGEVASTYLLRFAELMRQILDNSSQTKVKLNKEIEFIENYLHLEQLRLHFPFTFDIQIDSETETTDLTIAPMLLQPYIENAIWHGLSHKPEPGRIIINFAEQNEELVCSIEDNGVGRKRSAEIEAGKKRHQSRALDITYERITKGLQGTVEIFDLKNKKDEATGTRVVIKIPL